MQKINGMKSKILKEKDSQAYTNILNRGDDVWYAYIYGKYGERGYRKLSPAGRKTYKKAVERLSKTE